MKRLLLISFVIAWSRVSGTPQNMDCLEIEAMFAEHNDTTCHCFVDTIEWIGCSGEIMPNIYNTFTKHLTNETFVEKVWLWDNFMPTMPLQIFKRIRPRTLVIESNVVGKFRDGVFDDLGARLNRLELNNNNIKALKARFFLRLTGLEVLDLSDNKIDHLSEMSFDALPSLRRLSVNGNGLSILADDTFRRMTGLRRLDLANNHLTKITKRTFAGLAALEELNLANNYIISVEPGSFDHLVSLKTLNLGGNKLTDVSISSLASLQQLYLNNNSFFSMNNIKLSGLASLRYLSVDRNKLKQLPAAAFDQTPQLRILSLVSNKIENVDISAMAALESLHTLSLQNNRIKSLPQDSFVKLNKLRNLFLSGNRLQAIRERDFNGLTGLKTLDLSANRIVRVHHRSLSGLTSIQNLYLASNNLTSLDNNTFKYFEDYIGAVDLSENGWVCDCRLLWLTKWLAQHRPTVRHTALTVCAAQQTQLAQMADSLTTNCSRPPSSTGAGGGVYPAPGAAHSPWITALGVLLAVVSLLILTAIVVLYIQDGRALQKTVGQAAAAARIYDIRRVPSDMVTLIPKEETRPASAASHSHEDGVDDEAHHHHDEDAPYRPTTTTVAASSKAQRAAAGDGRATGPSVGSEKKVRFAEMPS